jgi:hypothetical protein
VSVDPVVIPSIFGIPLRVTELPLYARLIPDGRFVNCVFDEVSVIVGYASDLTVNVIGVIARPTM